MQVIQGQGLRALGQRSNAQVMTDVESRFRVKCTGNKRSRVKTQGQMCR